MDLRLENPKTADAFVAALAAIDVVLPVEVDPDNGAIVDAEGVFVCAVDEQEMSTAEDAAALASLIVMAINTCGGYRATREDS